MKHSCHSTEVLTDGSLSRGPYSHFQASHAYVKGLFLTPTCTLLVAGADQLIELEDWLRV